VGNDQRLSMGTRIKSTRILGQRFVLVLEACIYALPSGLVIVWAFTHRTPRTAFATLLTSLILAGVAAAIVRNWRWFFLLQAPLCFLSVLFVCYTLSYGMPPGRTLASLLIGASSEEIKGFVSLRQGRALVLLLAAWTAAYLPLAVIIRPTPIFDRKRSAVQKAYLTVSVLLLGLTVTDSAQLIDGIALQPMVGSVLYLAADLPSARESLTGGQIKKVPYGARKTAGSEVHIVIIGEAARRDSWSAYGYPRPTTPLLQALGNDVVWLRNVTADANLTEWAVPILLTGIPPNKIENTPLQGNIFDLAKEAGYRTAWLVNQDITISMATGVHADVLEFPPDFKTNINGRHTLDESLLPALRQELSRPDQPRFIGIHMMGSHWEYYNRYPARFQQFGNKHDLEKLSMISIFAASDASEVAVVDSYDNSVLYSDWFLRQVIDSAANLSVPATVTFFPDHGEDLQHLDGAAGHGAPIFTRHAFEIPAFIWFNRAYQISHPKEVAAIKQNATASIRSHDLFNTLGQLMEIEWPTCKSTRSFASEDFTPDERMSVIAGGKLVPDNEGPR
jgi:glucan phosphoethanolaminetransferase (alkaline phosphatase superfamily)